MIVSFVKERRQTWPHHKHKPLIKTQSQTSPSQQSNLCHFTLQ